MTEFQVSILAADENFYIGPCESLVIPTTEGLYGIQANHANMVAAIVPGIMTYTLPGGEKKEASVSTGIVKVEKNTVLVMLAAIERPEEIDENRARRKEEEAREALLQKKSMYEYREAQAALARTMVRLKVKNKNRNINL